MTQFKLCNRIKNIQHIHFVDQNCCRTVGYETNHNSTIHKYRQNKTKLHNSVVQYASTDKTTKLCNSIVQYTSTDKTRQN